MKALRKEPERRYGSVGEFSRDIERYLSGMPVKARKSTIAYRSGRFLRRHQRIAVRGPCGSGVVAGLAVWQAHRVARQNAGNTARG
jgi:eukaryotic-like serine/threonine-protein kinase